MKRFTLYTCSILLFIVVSSCDKVIDVKPDNIVSSSQIFSTVKTVKAAIASLYSDTQFEPFEYGPGFWQFETEMTGLTAGANYSLHPNIVGDGTSLGWWVPGYKAVRDINKFIAGLEKSNFSEEQEKKWLGEALFLRAYAYFSLAKRYGGVPIITKVQTYTGDNLGMLQVSRDKEKKVYDFISTELDSAVTLLGETSTPGRANKYVALALKSRAMLFAASEAENAQVRLNGVVGIPSQYADKYWTESFKASKRIIKSGKYSLYDKYPGDPAKNFQQLFLDVDNNPGVILAEYFKYPQKTTAYDLDRLPFEYASPHQYSSQDAPTLQLVEAFNYVDGSKGTLKIKNKNGKSIEYKNPLDLFKNKDPRLFATVMLPFSKWRGNVVHIRRGIITAAGDTLTSNSYSTLYKGMHIIGASGPGGAVTQLTGFLMRKYMNPAYPPSRVFGGSDQPWIIFRLGGILINYAEAAVELGKKSEAQWAINKLHDRAGMNLIKKPSEVTISMVHHEALVELFGEHKYYWDMKRWRIADKVLNNYYKKALYPFYVYPDHAYVFTTAKVAYPMTFDPRQYYLKIPAGEINTNPNLKQNPGY